MEKDSKHKCGKDCGCKATALKDAIKGKKLSKKDAALNKSSKKGKQSYTYFSLPRK